MSDFIKSLFSKIRNIVIPTDSDDGPADTAPLSEGVTARNEAASTTPLSETQLAEIVKQSDKIEPAQLIVGVARNVGRQRSNNQDSIFSYTATLAVDTVNLPFGVFILADGMGGHTNGEKASEMAVRAMGSHLMGKLFEPLFSSRPFTPEDSLQEIMKMGVHKAQAAVIQHAPGGGTTLTSVLVIDTQMTISHVGDSRAYAIYLDGRMQTLTRDHSLVQRLIELEQITAEEAATHPQRSMLYRALGQGDFNEPDVFTATLPNPGYLMICSDGLWGVITEETIFKTISEAPNPQRACQNLVEAANNAGGPDNITVILVRISD